MLPLPAEVVGHVEADQVAWLTTTTVNGTPWPTPVWFVESDGLFTIYSEPSAAKIANIGRQPTVVLHFNSDQAGHDIVVIRAIVTVSADGALKDDERYVVKYGAAIARLGFTIEEFSAASSTRLTLRPTRVWLGPTYGP